MNNQNIVWNLLSWNIRGLNSQDKWDTIRNNILDSGAVIVCLQETKREVFYASYISKFYPKHLNKFTFLPFVGASGGLIVVWNGSLFTGDIHDISCFAITMKFTSAASNAVFHLSNVYGPSAPAEKTAFVNWLYNFGVSSFEGWILVGDFNFTRTPENRNKPRGSACDMISNMQDDPLLENFDWVFTSPTWQLYYPGTSVKPLPRPISDHIPYVVRMDSHIPKANIFRFENYWADFPGFFYIVDLHWHSNPFFGNMAKTISTKFKPLRVGLRKWSKQLSQLNRLINNCSWVLAMLDRLEDQTRLIIVEADFRKILKVQLQRLLEAKGIYWKQRSTIRWLKFGVENSSLFPAMATILLRRNYIASLMLDDGSTVQDHSLKSGILDTSFKDRLGRSDFQAILFDLASLIQQVDFPVMDEPFSNEEIDRVVQEMASDHAPVPDGFVMK